MNFLDVLRAPVRKNQTYRGKGEKFDFFHILMSDRLGYNLNHCIVFSVKNLFISKKNATNENPFKSSFEALNLHGFESLACKNKLFYRF